MRKALIASLTVVAMVMGFAGAASAQDDPGTIVDIAAGNPDFSTLVTAVTEAGLAETLSGEGPFTVFAPTNAAFEALPEGTLDSLLADPQGALADILKLHVVSGSVDAAAATAAAGGTVDTLGGPVSVELQGESLVVGGATVVTADIQASNGIIHVIDAVITEPAQQAPAPAPAPAPADDAQDDGAMPMPNRVDTGDSGLAAQGGSTLLLSLLAVVALGGAGASTVALARARRTN